MAARQTAHTAPFPSHPHRWSALPASANALEPTITRFWRRWQEQGRSTAPLSVSASSESREREYVQVTVTRKTRALADGKIARAFFFYQDGTKIRALVLGRCGSGPLVLVLKRVLVADVFES